MMAREAVDQLARSGTHTHTMNVDIYMNISHILWAGCSYTFTYTHAHTHTQTAERALQT